MSEGLMNFLTALVVVVLYLGFCAEYTRTEDHTDSEQENT